MSSADFLPPPAPGLDTSGMAAGFSIVFTLAILAVVAGIAFSIFVAVRKYRVIKRSGHDPFTVDAAVAAKVLNSDLLRPGTAVDDAAPAKSLEQRLAEVDELHARGVISDGERVAARAAILAG